MTTFKALISLIVVLCITVLKVDAVKTTTRNIHHKSLNTKRSLENNGLITGSFSLVRAQQDRFSDFSQVLLGRFQAGTTINLDVYNSPTGYNIVFDTVVTNFTRLEIIANGISKIEVGAPYCLASNSRYNFSSSVYLSTLGPKTILLKGYYGTIVASTFELNFVLSRNSAPTSVTVPVPVKTPAPIQPIPKPTTNKPVPVRPPVAVPIPTRIEPVPILVPVPARPPSKAPVSTPVGYPSIELLQKRKWVMTDSNAPIEARHEACFLMVGRVAVLIGGRGKRRPDIYNPITKTWKAGRYPPNNILLHHFQCAAIGDKVWIVSAWTKGFPREENAPNIFIYDVPSDTWETRQPMPASRRRGSTAVIPIGNLLYVSHGNSGGHETGSFAQSYAWLDVYNTITDTWEVLPDGKFPRDHVGGAAVGTDGTKFCIAGGRIGGEKGWPVVAPTECYDIPSQTWTTEANIAIPRAGSSYGHSCDGQLLIAGGEGNGKAYAEFDAFDGTKWTKLPNMVQTRHGSGLAIDCACNAIYIASGNGKAGGGNELYSIETISFDDKPCTA